MAKNKTGIMKWIASILVIIGALNWGIYGVTRLLNKPFDLVTWIFGQGTVANIVFSLVGLAALCFLFTMRKY